MRNRTEPNTSTVQFGLRGLLLVFAIGGMAATSHSQDNSQLTNAAVRYMKVTAALARDRWETIQCLHREGYATAQELQNSEQTYQITMVGLEEAVAQSEDHDGSPASPQLVAIQLTSTPLTEGQANTVDQAIPQQILVHLPGLSRHKATRRFSTLLLSGVNLADSTTKTDDYTITAAPRRALIEKRIALQKELIRRLESINHVANVSPKELEIAQLRHDQLIAERDMVTPLAVITRPGTNRDATIPVAVHRPATDDESQMAIDHAIQAANAAVDQASAAVQHYKQSLTQHAQHYKTLSSISEDPLASPRECEREKLLLDTATASLAHARESLQCRQSELRYLQVFASSMDNPSQNQRLHDAVLALLRSHANRASAKEEWATKARYLEWKFAAIQSLFKDGHASWWENSQAELDLAEAEAAQAQADNQLAVAKRTLNIVEKALRK